MSDNEVKETVDTLDGKGSVEVSELSDGREVEVYRVRVRHMGIVMEFVSHILAALGVRNIGESINQEALAKMMNIPQFINFLGKSMPQAIDVMEALTSLTREEVEDLPVEDMILICIRGYNMNADFFSKTLGPTMRSLSEKINQSTSASPEKKSQTKRNRSSGKQKR